MILVKAGLFPLHPPHVDLISFARPDIATLFYTCVLAIN